MKKNCFILGLLFSGFCLTACSESGTAVSSGTAVRDTMHLDYAEQFSVEYLENGCAEISIQDGFDYLLVPDGVPVPEETGNQIILHQPMNHIYMAASSAMDLADALGSLDSIALTSTKDWELPAVQSALEEGRILYAGKYSAPDYELILSENCDLAIESTMIYHSPEAREQLLSLGIPVLVERSSYEAHPLGRMEWIKLYGLLLGKSDEAEQFFNQKKEIFQNVLDANQQDAGQKTAAFFYISPNGYINIRKPGDYISQMISLAGGTYLFTADDLQVDDNALSTMNIQTEVFYQYARDADVFIYNSTIEGELSSIDELISKCSVLADCKAIREGNVWCTGQNLFQQTTGAAEMIQDFYEIFHEENPEHLTFLHHLE